MGRDADDLHSDFLTTTAGLIRRFRQGETRAFTDLFERHYTRVLSSAALRSGRKLSACRAELEDVVQETFIYAWNTIAEGNFDECRSVGGFRNWIVQHVVVNKLRDNIRRKNALKRGGGKENLLCDLMTKTAEPLAVVDPRPSPSEIAEVGDSAERFEEAMLRISETHRMAIDLRYLCEMSYDEIAVEMGFASDSSARSAVHRGLKELQAWVERNPE